MSQSAYIVPEQVSSPKRSWKLLKVLDPGSENTGAVALGRWNNNPVLAMRWNGTEKNPLGNPQSRGLPTWFIVPDQYLKSVMATFPADKQALAKTFLEP